MRNSANTPRRTLRADRIPVNAPAPLDCSGQTTAKAPRATRLNQPAIGTPRNPPHQPAIGTPRKSPRRSGRRGSLRSASLASLDDSIRLDSHPESPRAARDAGARCAPLRSLRSLVRCLRRPGAAERRGPFQSHPPHRTAPQPHASPAGRPARRPAAALARWSRPLAPVALGPRPHAPPHRTWIVQQFENCSTIVRARRSNVESRTPGARAERTRGRAPRGGRGAHQRVSPPPAATAHMRCGAVRCWVGLKGAGPLDPAPTTQAPDERAERARRSAASRGRSSGPGAFYVALETDSTRRRTNRATEERSESRPVERRGGFPAVPSVLLSNRPAGGLSRGAVGAGATSRGPGTCWRCRRNQARTPETPRTHGNATTSAEGFSRHAATARP